MDSFSLWFSKLLWEAPARSLLWGNHPGRRRCSLQSFSFQPCSSHPLCLPPWPQALRLACWGGVQDVQSPGVLAPEGNGRGMENHGIFTEGYEEVNLGTDGFTVFRPNSPWLNSYSGSSTSSRPWPSVPILVGPAQPDFSKNSAKSI